MKFSLYLLFSLSIVTYTTAGLIRKKRKNGGKGKKIHFIVRGA